MILLAINVSYETGLVSNTRHDVTTICFDIIFISRYVSIFSADNVVELGAQWVHGERGNIVFALASPHKLLDSSRCFNDFSGHVFATARGEILPKIEAVETLKIYYDISEQISDDINNAESYGEYFIEQ